MATGETGGMDAVIQTQRALRSTTVFLALPAAVIDINEGVAVDIQHGNGKG